MKVLNHRQGHHMAHELEQAKIRCSDLNERTAVDLSFVEPGFAVQMAPNDMREHLAVLLGRVVACARECVQRADLTAGALDAIYLTGGSSALRAFQSRCRLNFRVSIWLKVTCLAGWRRDWLIPTSGFDRLVAG